MLDKPTGMTSTHAVSVVKRAFAAKKAGHAGTLDPLASGILPIALGEATKTVPFVMEGRKAYRFTVRWGVETDTDDAEGRAIGESVARPSVEAIRAALPAFVGEIMQTPPKYSALKIDGERAYDLAREGEEFTLEPRPVDITRLDLVSVPDADHAELEAECGKGTYVRALARDLGRALGTLGHVIALRRTAVGPFAEADAVGDRAPGARGGDATAPGEYAVLAAGRNRAWRAAGADREPRRRGAARPRASRAYAGARRPGDGLLRCGFERRRAGRAGGRRRRRTAAPAHLSATARHLSCRDSFAFSIN